METKKFNYSEVIELYAARRGMNLTELFRRAGIGKSTYYKSRAQNKFNTEVLERIAKALEVEVADLVKPPKSSNEMQKEIDEIKNRLNDIKRRLD